MPQSLPPVVPIMSRYFCGRIVLTCMRTVLWYRKNGLPVFFGSLRSRKSTALAVTSSSSVAERVNVTGPSSLQVWFFCVPSEDVHESTGRGGVRQVVVLGSTAPGTSGTPGISELAHGGVTPISFGFLN